MHLKRCFYHIRDRIIDGVIFLQGFEDIIPLNRLMIFDEREVEVNNSMIVILFSRQYHPCFIMH